MEPINSVQQKSKTQLHDNRDITSKTPKLLPCSSIVTYLDQGSNSIVTSTKVGVEEERSKRKWYYLFLRNSQIKRYIDIFEGTSEVCRYEHHNVNGINQCIKVESRKYCLGFFLYTSTDHKQRFEKCTFTEDVYKERRDAAFLVQDAFETESIEKLNKLTDKDNIKGDGYIFVYASLKDLRYIFSNTEPYQHLVTNIHSSEPIVIPNNEMFEFIYLYESMPYNIKLMERPIEDYIKKKQKIRITGGIFKGKEGCLMRLHRNSHVVFAFGNMTIAISNIHAFPFEKIE